MKVYFFHRALPQIAITNQSIVEMLLDELCHHHFQMSSKVSHTHHTVDMIEKWIIPTTTTPTKETQLQCHQEIITCLHCIVHPIVANPQLKSHICVMTIIFIITIVIITIIMTIVITNLVRKWKWIMIMMLITKKRKGRQRKGIATRGEK